jgi:hypothetical protein
VNQLSLFGQGSAPRRRGPRPQGSPADNLERVATNIAHMVLEFCGRRIGREFIGAELTEWVNRNAPLRGVHTVPDSTTRILRRLQAEGRLEYTLVSRAESRYRVTAVRKQGGAA